MPIAITSDKTSYGYLETATITLSGAVAATRYVVSVLTPGGHTAKFNVTTDGSGGGFVSLVCQNSRGSFAASVRPAAEYEGTTTPAATLNFKGQ